MGPIPQAYSAVRPVDPGARRGIPGSTGFGENNKKALGEEGLSEDSNVLRSDYFSQSLA